MSKHSERTAQAHVSTVQDKQRRLLITAIEQQQQELLEDIGFNLWHFRVAVAGEDIPTLAKEVLQETVVTALKKSTNYDPSRPARLWLRGIAVKVILHLRRKSRRERRHLSLVADTPQVRRAAQRKGAKGLSEDEMFDLLRHPKTQHESVQILTAEEILSVLEESDREIILLHHIEGLDGKELAAKFRTSEGTIYKRLSRARNRLRQKFLNEEE